MKLHVLDVKFNFKGREEVIYPVILHHEDQLLLIDCGYAGFMPLIENAANLQGITLDNLTGVIVTHHDIDHIGGLYEIKQHYQAIKVYSSGLEAAYISGKEKSLRLVQAEGIYQELPEDQKPGARAFQKILENVSPVEVDYVFPEAEEFLFLKGVKIIPTPGHMPGHISIYMEESKTLIAADALVCETGKLQIANPAYTLDLPQAIESVKKLCHLEIDRIVCYHGGVVEGNIREKLNSLVYDYSDSKVS
ncbi:MBL fold metallo-hydrolase [Pontibacter sp. H249]|uniref:MBL fold metallo-hydrolase n=1 Tax=Pontibacter sp. H249 TaxID=3133420 RepID=UPI0030BF05C4